MLFDLAVNFYFFKYVLSLKIKFLVNWWYILVYFFELLQFLDFLNTRVLISKFEL